MQQKNDPAPNPNSVEIENLCSKGFVAYGSYVNIPDHIYSLILKFFIAIYALHGQKTFLSNFFSSRPCREEVYFSTIQY